MCLALWIGFCIYFAVFERTPRAPNQPFAA